ncbi:MAG: MATE family efflux transporter [Clostridia bacterium]|nr:MATE family efflux transporter [Clostridia bacterium]
MTEEPVEKLVLSMAAPAIVSMLVSSVYNMADTFFVGKIDTSATGAVGVVFPVMAIIQAFGFFFGHGSGNYVSRALGRKDHEKAERMAVTGFLLSIFAGILISAVGLIFRKDLIYLLGSTDTIYPYAESYLTVILIGAPWMCSSFVLNNQLRFQGNATYAMVGISAGSILNIALDPLFIFTFKMEIAGAAWATILSQAVSFVLLYIGTLKSDNIRLRLSKFTPNLYYLKNMAVGGVPSLCRQGLNSLATVCLNFACHGSGDAAIAAMSVVTKVMMFATSALIGFGQGFQPVCGFNYGAGKFSRVRRAYLFCAASGVAFLFLLAVAAEILAPQIVALFRDDPDVIRIGAKALRLQCVIYPLNAIVIMSNMLFQTIGKMFRASFLAMSRQGLFFIPLVLLLPALFGFEGVMYAQPAADLISLLAAIPLTAGLLKDLKTDREEESPRKE